ncbi:MAG: peptide chain release factor-like protein [Myxococcota bacterium]
MSFRVTGEGSWDCFSREAGGHRWQRIPPNDKRKRVHTSTVTVAVFIEAAPGKDAIDMSKLRWETFRGSGAGGQHRNKTDSGVRLTHLPTGLTVRIASGRSQAYNKVTALRTLQARLREERESAKHSKRAAARKAMVGTGMRGDKVRTIRAQDDWVTDHRTGRRIRLRDYQRGIWGDLLD